MTRYCRLNRFQELQYDRMAAFFRTQKSSKYCEIAALILSIEFFPLFLFGFEAISWIDMNLFYLTVFSFGRHIDAQMSLLGLWRACKKIDESFTYLFHLVF